MPKTKKLDTVIKIHGIPLETKDTIYEVTSKYDADASDGFKNNRTTKLLDDDAGKNTVSAVYDTITGLWDTGLYKESPMYRGLNETQRNELANQVEELIVKPFERVYGEGKLDPRDPDSEYWNYVDKHRSFKVDLYKGKIFNTSEPRELLQLFICVANKDLAPREFESAPMFRNAQFCMEDKKKVQDTRVEEEILETEASGQFFNLLDKPDTLKLILNYIGLRNVNTKDKGLANSLFRRFIGDKQQSYQNKKLFLDAVKLNSEKKGKKEIEYYTSIDTLINKGKIQKMDGTYFAGEVELGVNLKAAAVKASGNTKIQLQIDKLLEEI